MQWYEAPDIHEVNAASKNLARIRGEILRKKREIQKSEDVLKAKYPRKPELRRQELEILYDTLTSLEIEEIEAAQSIEFYNMWLKMCQAFMYRKG